MRQVYADHAATTPPLPEVLEAMTPYLTRIWGNPSSPHRIGQEARAALEDARRRAAASLGAAPDEFYFTGGGTESDNWALKGAAYAQRERGKTHLVTTAFEHPAVLNSCRALEREGFSVTYLDVPPDGVITPEQVEEALTDETGLVSVMAANNEIGTIQPLSEIGTVCREHGVLLHTDAVQAVGNIPVDLRELPVDLLSLSGHKFHGPKGAGALFVRRGVTPRNLLDGGAQEGGRRAGTENLAGMIGLAKALELTTTGVAKKSARLIPLRDRLIRELTQLPGCRLTGHPVKRLPGLASFCFEGVSGESLLLALDLLGVQCSSGSACSSGSLEPSHVLLALGLPPEIARGSLRLSLGDDAAPEDVDYILETLPSLLRRLRGEN